MHSSRTQMDQISEKNKEQDAYVAICHDAMKLRLYKCKSTFLKLHWIQRINNSYSQKRINNSYFIDPVTS